MGLIVQRILFGCGIGVIVVAALAFAARPDPLIRILLFEKTVPVIRHLLPEKVDSPAHVRKVRLACIAAALLGLFMIVALIFFVQPVPPRH